MLSSSDFKLKSDSKKFEQKKYISGKDELYRNFGNLVNIPEGNRGKRREEFLKWSGEDVLAPKTVVKGEEKNWDHKYEVDPEKLQKIFKRAVGEDAAKEFVKFHNKKAEEYRKELEKKRRENMENKNKGVR